MCSSYPTWHPRPERIQSARKSAWVHLGYIFVFGCMIVRLGAFYYFGCIGEFGCISGANKLIQNGLIKLFLLRIYNIKEVTGKKYRMNKYDAI